MSEQAKLEEISKCTDTSNEKVKEESKLRFEVSKDWNISSIEEVSEIKSGSTPKTSVDKYWDGNIAWLTPTEVTQNSGVEINDTERHLTDEGLDSCSAHVLPKKSLLVTTRATIGEAAVNNIPMATNQGFKNLIPRDSMNVYYLYYQIHHMKDYLESLGSGSTYSEVSKSILRRVNVPVAPAQEQEKIASVLYNVDRAIQKTEEIIEQTKRVKKGLMQDLFTEGYFEHGKIVRVNELKTSSGSINTSLDETTIGEIPESWGCKRLGEVTNNSSYGAAESAEDYDPEKPRYIRITDISGNGLLKNEEKKSLSKEKAEKYLLNPGKILFARSGATVGKTFLYTEEDPEAVYGGYLIKFDPDRSIILPKFLFYYTHTTNYRKWVERVTRKGAQENINAREYSSILLPIPSIEEQKKIVDGIGNFYDKIKLENEFISNLNSLKKGLMQDLLTGKVRTKKKPVKVLEEVRAHG